MRCHPRFNERGFAALDPKWSGGRPKTIDDQVRERLRADWGITAFSTWSLAKPTEHLIQRNVVSALSRETLPGFCARAKSPGRPPRRGRLPPTRIS
ncbi:helix-turn-helix domain-containing protein [Nonomuraea recticatena]|uniref:helix-turn-helix domain-containing protein n=1 Tax=Nonomuraea recticatena TaxID=46178 RepID=UPI00361D023A